MLSRILNGKENKKLVANFFSLLVLRGFQFLMPLLTFPYLVRVIGLEKFGLINFALSLSVFLGAIVQFGFGITVARDIARNREDLIEVAKIYSASMVAGVLLAVACTVPFALVIFSFDRFNEDFVLYFLAFVFVMFQSLFPEWFFRGVEEMKYIAILSLSANALFLINIWIFVRQEGDYLLVPLLNAVSAFLIYLFSIFIIRFQFGVRFSWPGFKEVGYLYKSSSHAFIAQFSPNLYNNASVFLLGLFHGASVVGAYTAATKVIDAVISFGYVLANTFLPYLSRNIKAHGGFQKIMLCSGVGLSVLVFFGAEVLSEILFGLDNKDISLYIKWLAVAIVLGFIYLTYSSNYLMISGYERLARNIALYVSIVALFYTLVMIYFFGIYGAIGSLLLSRGALSVCSFVFYKKVRAKC